MLTTISHAIVNRMNRFVAIKFLNPGAVFLLCAIGLVGCGTYTHKEIDWNTLYVDAPSDRTIPFPLSVALEYEGAGENAYVEYAHTLYIGGIPNSHMVKHYYDEQALMLEYGQVVLGNIFSEIKTASDADLICTISADASVTPWKADHKVALRLAIRTTDGANLGTYTGPGLIKSIKVFDEIALYNAYKLAFIDATTNLASSLPVQP